MQRAPSTGTQTTRARCSDRSTSVTCRGLCLARQPAPKRRGSTDSDEYEVGKDYARPSNRRIRLSYGATEQNVRDEERDCPVPLKRYRESLSRRAPTTDRDEIRALTDRIFGAIDYAIKENDVPHLLRAWVAGDEPGSPCYAVRSRRG